jgi:ATP-dependent protease ClpP protease subunit
VPGWKDISKEIAAAGSASDVVRRKYLAALADRTKRNVILYYSGWLQKPPQLIAAVGPGAISVADADKSAFMAVIHELDRKKGLDLVLHTPGGETAATESLVQYLHDMFPNDIRAIVPQLAMSAGTMIACACKQIIMGAHSSLGPIDPQFNGIPAHGVVEEFERARKEIEASPSAIPLWQPIIAKYTPTFVGECEKAITWSKEIVKDWLCAGMLAQRDDRETLATSIVEALGDHAEQRSHSRHISLEKARAIGLDIFALEDDKGLQDAVLSVHHACIQTFQQTNAFKIVENHKGVAAITATTFAIQPFGPVSPLGAAQMEASLHDRPDKPRKGKTRKRSGKG